MRTNEGPGADDDALTRPTPTVEPRSERANDARIAASPAFAPATVVPTPDISSGGASSRSAATTVRAPYAHRFGSKPFYLFARLAAFAIDVVGLAFVLATFAFHGVGIGVGAAMFGGHDANAFALVAAVSFGIALLVAFLFEAFIGTTPGKLLFALHVRRADGGHPSIGRVFVRALLRPIDALAIGPLLALVTPKRQRLGDLVGGTVVSGSPLRWFAPLVGLGIIAGVAYAQYAFGGGLDSAIGVAAETANDAPAAISRAIGAVGALEPHATQSQPTAIDTAAPQASAAP